jgi:hypothetical protein
MIGLGAKIGIMLGAYSLISPRLKHLDLWIGTPSILG